MSSQSYATPESASRSVAALPALRQALAGAWAFNRTLTIAILFNLALIPVTILLAIFDPVTITGVNGWIKPLKFAISISIYTATFLWFLSYIKRGKFWVWLVATLIGALLIGENVLIMMQVARGTASHFNNATPYDAAVFSAMGTMIMVVALASLVVAIWLLFERLEDRVLLTGLRWGVWLTMLGMLVTMLMVMPTPSQQAKLAAGAQPAMLGAHSVGVEDGGMGLPILGWSTTGGDLRVGHFVGLHALQILPLAAWILSRARAKARWTVSQRVWLVRVVGSFYFALIGLLTWQALRGQPLIYPDWLTVSVFGLMVAGATVAAAAIGWSQSVPSTYEIMA